MDKFLDIKIGIIEKLIDVGAIKFDSKKIFKWTSGIQSPIYFDNRLIMSYTEIRDQIITLMADTIKNNYTDITLIAGTATAGIPHAAMIAQKLNLPMVYIRGNSKKHGTNKMIEGKECVDEKVIVIDDLISTGGSAINATNEVKKNQGEVLGVLSIFDYGLDISKENFKKLKINHISILSFTDLLIALKNKDFISETEIRDLTNWRNNLSLETLL